jgi:hypothetical protein
MGRNATGVYLIDDAVQLSITQLKSWGYLNPGTKLQTVIDWSRNGQHISSISASVNMTAERPYIELSYSYQTQQRKSRVYLTATKSNLGKGVFYYFVCPHTGKRCRKLYAIGGYFYHRSAFKSAMYGCQTKSHEQRDFGKYLQVLNVSDAMQKPYFKTTYAGKPTKRYLKLAARLEQIYNAM